MKTASRFPDRKVRIKKPRQVTEERLFNAAVFYLQRFSATAAHVKTILQRKVKKWTETEPDWAIGSDEKIATVIERIVGLGYINDAVFAQSRVRSLRRQGKSTQTIKQHLSQKGVKDAEVLSDSLEKGDLEFVQENRIGLYNEDEADPDDTITKEAELHALQRFIKRKRLLQSDDPEQQKKDLAKILRGGFGWSLVKRVIDVELSQ